MTFAPSVRSLLNAVVAHSGRRFGALIARMPVVVSLPVACVPVAFAMALVVAALASAEAPIQRSLALPVLETHEPWPAVHGRFAGRLEDVFGIDDRKARKFAEWILEASARQQVPPELIAGMIYTESSFRMRVRSWAGAVGPAQVKPKFWSEFCGGGDLTDPEHNVYCGAQILAHYMQQCGEFECAIRLYNVGPGNMRKAHFRQASHRYLAKVESHRSRMEDAPLL
ncbi:MAG TPA: lytic transglycosylase domain-containing protein [Pseudomonadales bacterium]|nr:lytic transglycosylase domain-containing protein [Pseudomonadales bacterium]